MSPRQVLVLAIAAGLAAITGDAPAAPRRIAIVVGNNLGHGDDQPLRYAERDATRVAAVLRELGRFDDVMVLAGRDAGAAGAALASFRRRASELRAAGHQVLFAFYYSGHGSSQGLHLGATQLDFAALLDGVRAIDADVRFVIVDACEAGALTRRKGLHARAPADIHLVDAIDGRGEAILASTSESEGAQESEVLKGSFFTSHLVTGLRGAADRNGDGVVGLREAYEYAHDRTIASTVISAAGVQRPSYAVRLRGAGDVPLAWPGSSRAFLALAARSPGSFVVLSADEGVVLAEVEIGAGAHQRIALAPGSYWVKKRGAGAVMVTRVELREGMSAALDESEMARVPYASLTEKGSQPPDMVTVGAGLAMPVGAIQSTAPMSIEFGYVMNFERVGLWGSLALAGGRTTNAMDGAIFELRPQLALVLRSRFRRWEAFYGAAASAPIYLQFASDGNHSALGAGLDGLAGAALWATDRVALSAHVALGARLVDRVGWSGAGVAIIRYTGVSLGARLRF